MDFLVRMELQWPAASEPERRQQLVEQEFDRGLELLTGGTLRSIWRVPGRKANVSIWRAEDASALHASLESLPLYDWLDIVVEALGDHPLNQVRRVPA